MKKKQTTKTDINKATNEVLAEILRQEYFYLLTNKNEKTSQNSHRSNDAINSTHSSGGR